MKLKPTKKKVLATIAVVALVITTPVVVMANGAIKSQGNFNFMNGEAVFYSSDLRYLDSKVEEQITAITEGKNNIANAIESKGVEVTSESTIPTFLELVSGINSIGTLGTAGVGDVLAGETFYTSEGYKEGKMINYAGKTIEMDTNVKVTGNRGSFNMPDSGYYDTSSILTFTLDPSSFSNLTGNATESKVLTGYTFYNTDSNHKITGTMKDYSNINQSVPMSSNGNIGTINIPSQGYYNTSSALSFDMSNLISEIQKNTFYQIGSVKFTTTQHDVYETIDCTGINGWQNLTSNNFLAVPTMVRVFFNNESGNVYDFGGTLGNINDPARGLFEYDATTGLLKVYGNGTDMTPNEKDTITLWYQDIDVYLVQK